MRKEKDSPASSSANDVVEVRCSLDRREFIELAALGAASHLCFSNSAQGATFPSSATDSFRASYARFHSLAPGVVEPEGWLRLYLQKQADQLGGHLAEVAWPFTEGYWAGKEPPIEENGLPPSWWPWEQRGYWIDGMVRCSLVLQDEKLEQSMLVPVRYTLEHASPDGYLGPMYAKDAEKKKPRDCYRWPHTVFFRALAAYGEATEDPLVAAAIRRHYLADQHRVSYGGPSRDVTNVEAMLWAYERTGDAQLLAMAEQAWNDFLQSSVPGDRDSGDLHPDRVFANTPIHSHAVTYIEKAKLPAILYVHTGKPEYLRFALAAQARIFSHHMLIDGIPSATENYYDTRSINSHETCDISDHTWSWGYLLMATGDGIWADRIERACFNAGLGAIKKDWKAVQYFSSTNQVIAIHPSPHVPLQPEDRPVTAYCPDPGYDVACCAGNIHRLFPNYVIRMWMADSEGGLAATLFGASVVRAEVGLNHRAIEIHEETNYPFDEEIRFTIRSEKAVTFPLSLRIPGWCKEPRLALNGHSLELPPIHKGFIQLKRTFQPNDRITLTLPMHTEVSYWINNNLDDSDDALGFEHGPLVYALAIKEDWTPVVTPKWSTSEFPEWNARAAGPWNYGVVFDDSVAVSSQAKIERKSMTEDPWVEPPISLSVSVKKIPGWELIPVMPLNGTQTPPLPTNIDGRITEALEKVEIEHMSLVPYGSTQLRVTIFLKA